MRAMPERSTAEALAMGIDRRMSSYKTYYSGYVGPHHEPAARRQGARPPVVPPGGTFWLNGAIGERTLERGFRPAPVIIGNEYAEEVGGGTSQVATTVFNAARRDSDHRAAPHSLYISRYELGRDATVYWPSLDLKFVNDTKSWVLVKGFAEGDGISVGIYGGETRRIDSSATPARPHRPRPGRARRVRRCRRGRSVVEEEGPAPTKTTATREIYSANGELSARRRGPPRTRARPASFEIGTKVVTKPPKKPTEAGGRHDCPYAADDPAVANASASHSGIRVGRYVSASTVACRVWPSATSSPSRSMTYS